MTGYHHEPVLLREVVEAMAPARGEIFVDCTLGGGGHASALLEAADCSVIGIDRDPSAVAAASARLRSAGDRFQAIQSRFSELHRVLDRWKLDEVDGVLIDLGVSSHQLDTAERGFSFRSAGPLDMRMDPTSGPSAAEIVNTWEEDALADVIQRYGEERHARRVARRIVAGRPWNDTLTLAHAVASVVGGGGRIHPATRTFQGLRIAVNDELGELERLLPIALDRLRPGGRLVAITFHSLEDRLVKRFFDERAGKGRPRDAYGNPIGPVHLRLRPDRTVDVDTEPNPRARSARLRSAVRLPWNRP